MAEYEGRVISQEHQVNRAYAEAHEAGDIEKMTAAQTAIAQVAIEKERLRVQKARAATSTTTTAATTANATATGSS